MRGSRTLALWIFLAARTTGAQAPEVPAMSAEARGHLELGMRHYQAQDFDRALAEFRAGYAIDPRPDFLYAMGQAHRRRGDCTAALAAYRSFLESRPPPEEADRARQNIDRCEPQIERSQPAVELRPQATPAPASPPATPPELVRLPVTSAPRGSPPWYSDVSGGVLAASGLVAIGVGTVFFYFAGLYSDLSSTAPSSTERDLDLAGASMFSTTGIVALVLGAGLFVSAAVRYSSLPARVRQAGDFSQALRAGSLLLYRF